MRASLKCWSAGFVLLTWLVLPLPLLASDSGQASNAAPRLPQSHSVEQANATLEQVSRDRAAVQAVYEASESVCITKFFVNYCLDHAKEQRRSALAALRAIEVEAEHYKRADSVARRDADLAERALKDEQEQAARAAQPPKPPKVADDSPRPAPHVGPVIDREAEHAAKVQRQAERDAADAGKRAAAAAAYAQKQVDAAQRQAQVAKKKAESDARRAAQAVAEQKRAEAAAAAAAARKQ